MVIRSRYNAAQELLKSINSSIGGLQNTLLAQNMQFTIDRGRFMQILHVSGNYWIAIEEFHLTSRASYITKHVAINMCCIGTR